MFVVGAGASTDFGLPVGETLKGEIASLLDFGLDSVGHRETGDQAIFNVLRSVASLGGFFDPHEFDLLIETSLHVRDGMPLATSIDTYLNSHNDDKRIKLCGKLGIVRAIHIAESNSHLAKFGKEPFGKALFPANESSWLKALFAIISDRCNVSDLPSRLASIAFVVFNYDRCLEHYLYWAFRTYYKLDGNEAAELVKQVEIFHPYGSAGNLEWYSSENVHFFGSSPVMDRLVQVSNSIRTFTEETTLMSTQLEWIQHVVRRCRRLVFVGFSFHQMNVELILPKQENDSTPAPQVFGTAYGISDYDVRLIKKDLGSRLKTSSASIQLRNDLKGSALFHQFKMGLSLN